MPYWVLFASLQEMDKRDFNGPNFRYRVLWRRVVGSGPNWHTNYTTAPSFIVSDIGNFSAFEIKVQAVNDKGDGPEPDPIIGYSGEDGKITASPLLLFLGIFRSVFFRTSHPSCLSLSLSSIGGSHGCGCCANKQHYHQSDLGSSGERDGQRTPAGVQGTDAVSLLLF